MKKTTKALWIIFISVFLAFALVSCALDIPGLSANNPPDNSGEKEPSKNPEDNESNPEEETKKEKPSRFGFMNKFYDSIERGSREYAEYKMDKKKNKSKKGKK